jgi:hypothetical protein
MALIGSENLGETWPPGDGQGGPGVKTYEVEVNGVTTTLLLSDEDAKAAGLTAAPAEQKAPATKQRTPLNKSVSLPHTKGSDAGS